MRNSTVIKRALPALFAALFAACGGSDPSGDTYNGAMDPTGFDLKFQPITSSASTALKALCQSKTPLPCYPAQAGFAHGKAIRFYNMVNTGSAVKTSAVATLVAKQQPQAFNFPNGCTQGRTIDPRFDAYGFDVQYPVFRSMPLAVTSGNVLPLAAIYSASLTANTCNDVKSADSLDAGEFGAQEATSPTAVQMWPLVDPTANFEVLTGATIPAGAQPTPPMMRQAWSKGLQGSYLDGGAVPVDAGGNLVQMDGVILNPAGSSPTAGPFAFTTDSKVVILPAVPGEDGYSPIVRLRQFILPTGKKAGDYTDLCPVGTQTCAANQVPMTATTAPNNTIFIVAQAQ